MSLPRLDVLVDPLCGWCYGAGAALERIAPQVDLALHPVGLFAGEGATALSPGFAAHAWAADQRIAALSGRDFSAAYRERVLGAAAGRLDSGPATLALVAAELEAPARGLAALHAIQRARYVEGLDVTEPAVLADVLASSGFPLAAARIASPDDALQAAAAARMAGGRALMRRFGLRGVPALIAGPEDARRPVPTEALYGPEESLIAAIR